MRDTTDPPRAWWRRLAWLVAIWAASVLALGLFARVFRWVMQATGLTG